ncbi:conserved Plasmodium protein, unknown function [Plasmodium ovale]|uniref:FAD-binding domain-containing protein n=2 Tax=Plasmodium ovale TaxID=36330 RepID=A0A1A8VLU1_PLAOA|nr:conserved Plasmodium protein, unknown function [Plasmodium ovale curtisi]SBS83290.1 conserved Plasmodium protein, unknown function [Plasmodium ovale curtisi]SCA48717.1 conserved Plasmodium protein, unknown function [Plasmodium ovale]
MDIKTYQRCLCKNMEEKERETDVLIVGISTGGLILSLDLIRQNVEHTIINSYEQNEEREKKNEQYLLYPRTVELLQDLNLLPEILSRSLKLIGINFYIENKLVHQTGKTFFQNTNGNIPYMLCINKIALNNILLRNLKRFGVSVEYTTVLRGIYTYQCSQKGQVENKYSCFTQRGKNYLCRSQSTDARLETGKNIISLLKHDDIDFFAIKNCNYCDKNRKRKKKKKKNVKKLYTLPSLLKTRKNYHGMVHDKMNNVAVELENEVNFVKHGKSGKDDTFSTASDRYNSSAKESSEVPYRDVELASSFDEVSSSRSSSSSSHSTQSGNGRERRSDGASRVSRGASLAEGEPQEGLHMRLLRIIMGERKCCNSYTPGGAAIAAPYDMKKNYEERERENFCIATVQIKKNLFCEGKNKTKQKRKGTYSSIRSKFIVGVDGRKSIVRKYSKIKMEKKEKNKSVEYITVDVCARWSNGMSHYNLSLIQSEHGFVTCYPILFDVSNINEENVYYIDEKCKNTIEKIKMELSLRRRDNYHNMVGKNNLKKEENYYFFSLSNTERNSSLKLSQNGRDTLHTHCDQGNKDNSEDISHFNRSKNVSQKSIISEELTSLKGDFERDDMDTQHTHEHPNKDVSSTSNSFPPIKGGSGKKREKSTLCNTKGCLETSTESKCGSSSLKYIALELNNSNEGSSGKYAHFKKGQNRSSFIGEIAPSLECIKNDQFAKSRHIIHARDGRDIVYPVRNSEKGISEDAFNGCLQNDSEFQGASTHHQSWNLNSAVENHSDDRSGEEPIGRMHRQETNDASSAGDGAISGSTRGSRTAESTIDDGDLSKRRRRRRRYPKKEPSENSFADAVSINSSGEGNGGRFMHPERGSYNWHITICRKVKRDPIEECLSYENKSQKGKYIKVVDIIKKIFPNTIILYLYNLKIRRHRDKMCEKYFHNCIILAGESNCLYNPLFNVGINMTIQDVYNIGWKLKYILKHDSSLLLLASYQNERKIISEKILSWNRETINIFLLNKSSTHYIIPFLNCLSYIVNHVNATYNFFENMYIKTFMLQNNYYHHNSYCKSVLSCYKHIVCVDRAKNCILKYIYPNNTYEEKNVCLYDYLRDALHTLILCINISAKNSSSYIYTLSQKMKNGEVDKTYDKASLNKLIKIGRLTINTMMKNKNRPSLKVLWILCNRSKNEMYERNKKKIYLNCNSSSSHLNNNLYGISNELLNEIKRSKIKNQYILYDFIDDFQKQFNINLNFPNSLICSNNFKSAMYIFIRPDLHITHMNYVNNEGQINDFLEYLYRFYC